MGQESATRGEAQSEGGAVPGPAKPALKMTGRRYVGLYLAVYGALQAGWWLGPPWGFASVFLAVMLPPFVGASVYRAGSVGHQWKADAFFFQGRALGAAVTGGVMWGLGALFSIGMTFGFDSLLARLMLGTLPAMMLFMGQWIATFRSTTEIFVYPEGITIFKGGDQRWSALWPDVKRILFMPGGKYSGSSVSFEATDGRATSVDDMEDLPWKPFEPFVRAVRIEAGRRPHVEVEDKLPDIGQVEPTVVDGSA